MKLLIKKIWLYFKYPVTLKIDLHKFMNYYKFKNLGLNKFPPNYIYFNNFNEESVVIDIGCGYLAEFSTTLIKRHKLKAFAVDPTKKHEPYLKKIEEKFRPNFHHLKYALSSSNGETLFYESSEHESGSLLKTHKNILSDTIVEYRVQLIDLPNLFKETGKDKIDFLKIDIEGAEYQLFNSANLEALKIVEQLFIEFHHLSVKDYNKKDTLKIVNLIMNEGFKSFSFDGINYLFFK